MQQILLVDDDHDLCLLLDKLLTRKGYQVTTKYSGQTALCFLEGNDPDLVLCGLRLADIDGISVLRKVKEKKVAVPFIMMTAYSDIQMLAAAVNSGAFDYLTKPI